MISSPPLRPSILLVEDSDDDAYFFARLLKKCGGNYSYVHVSDGRAALRYLEKHTAPAGPEEDRCAPPDLVFLDLKLPVVSGFEILNVLAERNLKPPLDVAILSGSDQRSDVERAQVLGVSQYLVKPLRLEQLQARLEVWRSRNTVKPEPDSVSRA